MTTNSTVTYETVKTFELQTGLKTRLLVEVSSRISNGKRRFRVGTFRVYTDGEGIEKRSAYLGTRELGLKSGLEKAALAFIASAESEPAPATPAA